MTIAVNAHYDGKVIVPDEPLNLPPNQKLRIQVEPIDGQAPTKRVDLGWLLGMGRCSPLNPNPRFPDDDSIWEGSIGDTLANDPRKQRPGGKK
jgi:hypothetical protein